MAAVPNRAYYPYFKEFSQYVNSSEINIKDQPLIVKEMGTNNFLFDNYRLIKKSVNRLIEGKIYFIEYLKKNNINYFNSYANFIHVNFGSSKKKILNELQKKIYFRLEEKHKSMKGFSRISLTSKKNFKIIKKIIDNYI